jgi:hypothetical protein
MERGRVGRRRGALCAAVLVGFVVFSMSWLAPGEPGTQPPGTQPPRQSARILELRNLMSQAEFRAAGLDKLSGAELAALDGWIGRMVARLLLHRKQVGCTAPIESRIGGEFQGWSGRTMFGLENGQVWRQLGTAVHYAYKVSPRAAIRRTADGCALKVEGVEIEVLVERVR